MTITPPTTFDDFTADKVGINILISLVHEHEDIRYWWDCVDCASASSRNRTMAEVVRSAKRHFWTPKHQFVWPVGSDA